MASDRIHKYEESKGNKLVKIRFYREVQIKKLFF